MTGGGRGVVRCFWMYLYILVERGMLLDALGEMYWWIEECC